MRSGFNKFCWGLVSDGITIYTDYNDSVNAITHPGPHHADDVFATVMLSKVFAPLELYRTRDEEIIRNSHAIVYDVGFVYDRATNRYDHHQKDFSEFRVDGTKYASAGLIWREYGFQIVKKVCDAEDEFIYDVVKYVDDNFVKHIDASDNGQEEGIGLASVSALIGCFNPLWDKCENSDDQFLTACQYADVFLMRVIHQAITVMRASFVIQNRIENCTGPVLFLENYFDGWQNHILNSECENAKNILYVIFPALNGKDWNIQAVPPALDRMTEQRKPFPEAWRGLRGDALVKVTKVPGSVFCHSKGFFAVADSSDNAVILANLAANS